MANMIVKDGAGASKYIGAEGAGSDVDPYIIDRHLVGGNYRLKGLLTRPANATAYAALDCLADATPATNQILAGAGRIVGGSGTIIRAIVKTDNLSWTSPISVVIYDGDGPASFIADNTADFDPKKADWGDVVCTLTFGSFVKAAKGAAGSYVQTPELSGLNIPYVCGAATDDLYYQCFVPAGNTPTPASAQEFFLNIGVIRD